MQLRRKIEWSTSGRTTRTSKIESWDDYRRRRRWFLAIWLTYIPGVFALGYPISLFTGSETPIYIIAGAWMLAFIAVENYMDAFPCPRCLRAFFWKRWFHNPLARQCVHCRFAKWAYPESE